MSTSNLLPAYKLVTTNIGGKSFTCSARTEAHLKWTIEQLKKKYPKATLRIIQPCYRSKPYYTGGAEQSAGTHDYDGVFDVEIVGIPWLTAQSFLRSCGWAAWWRHTGQWAAEKAWHIHMCSIPPGLKNNCTYRDVIEAYRKAKLKVGEFVPGQIVDYFNWAMGLKGQHDSGDDPTWHPKDIAKTIFDYDRYFEMTVDDLHAYLTSPKGQKVLQDAVRTTELVIDQKTKKKMYLGAILTNLFNRK